MNADSRRRVTLHYILDWECCGRIIGPGPALSSLPEGLFAGLGQLTYL